jgi:uncharacterized HhH-GPD family protein
MGLWLSGDADADRVLTDNALALVIGMVLDQQVPFERAFSAPAELQRRMGKPLTTKQVAKIDADTFSEMFTRTKALHRFPGAMAERVQRMCATVDEQWGGDVSSLWTTAKSGDELVKRLEGLPGFGAQKARIFAALLGKQLGCKPRGWRKATSPYGDVGTSISVADISDAASLDRVRQHKRAAKAANRAAK